MSVIATRTGFFDLGAFIERDRGRPAQRMPIYDIAWSLAGRVRYGGHGARWVSVARHCVIVSKRARWLATLELERKDLSARASAEVLRDAAAWGLFHDAEEALLGDILAPIKGLKICADLAALGESLRCAFFEAIYGRGVGEQTKAIVHRADLECRVAEKAVLFPDHELDFNTGDAAMVLAIREQLEALPETPDPNADRHAFIRAADELGLSDDGVARKASGS